MTSETRDDVWALLRQVGLTRAGGSFDALADPTATEALAALLSDRLRPLGPSLLVVWEGLNSTVLGYAVGARLGVPVLVLTDDEGLVSTATPPRSGPRAVFLASLSPDLSITRMAAGYLESRSILLVATAVLLARFGDVGLGGSGSRMALAERPADVVTPSGLPGPSSDQDAGAGIRQALPEDKLREDRR